MVKRRRIGVWGFPEDHRALRNEGADHGGKASWLLEQMIEDVLDVIERERRLPVPSQDGLEYGFRATEFWEYGYYEAPRPSVMYRLHQLSSLYGLTPRQLTFLSLRIGCAALHNQTFSLTPKTMPNIPELLGIAP